MKEEQAFLLSAHVTSLTSSQAPSCAKDYLTPVSSVCAGGHAAIRRRFVPVVLPGLRLALLLFHREELWKVVQLSRDQKDQNVAFDTYDVVPVRSDS